MESASPIQNDNPHSFRELAIARATTSIAVFRPIYKRHLKLESVSLLYANPSFCQLMDVASPCAYADEKDEAISFLTELNIRGFLQETLRENMRQSTSVKYRKQEQSLVLHLTAEPVDGLLVTTINDTTSLSHGHEMLEQLNGLMEENVRAMETVRSALESEIKQRKQLEDKLRMIAGTDHLSGLANRRSFFEKATAEYRRSRRYNHSLSMVMLDLDHFKRVNDTYGHTAGDTVIVSVSQISQSLSREGVDCVGRLGGEEFAILLPETNLQGAKNFAERLRLMIENTPIYCDIKKLNITASLGVAALQEQDCDFATLLNRADAALYVAKETGRNMVSAG